MQWKDVKTLLAKTSGFLQAEILLRKTVADVVSEALGVSVAERDLKIKDRIVTLRSHPALKNEVLFKKVEILNLLKARGVGAQVADIR